MNAADLLLRSWKSFGAAITPPPHLPPNLWNLIIHSQPLEFPSARSVHILTSYFFEINFNNILLFNNPNWSLLFRYYGCIFKRISHLTRIATYPSSFQVDTVHPIVFIYVLRVIQEESPIFLEVIVSAMVKKNYVDTCLVLNCYRDTAE